LIKCGKSLVPDMRSDGAKLLPTNLQVRDHCSDEVDDGDNQRAERNSAQVKADNPFDTLPHRRFAQRLCKRIADLLL